MTSPPAFSSELKDLAARFDDRSARLRDLLEATQTRGYHFLLFVIALPFVGPIPLPGFSIPFGAAIALIGAGTAVNRPPWLPAWLLERRLPASAVARTLRGAFWIVTKLERFTRPRWSRLAGAYVCQRAAGGITVICGLLMTLPLPLPFSNSLPAWTVLFLTAGVLAGDGLCLFTGVVSFLLTLTFFALVFVGGGKLLASFLAM